MLDEPTNDFDIFTMNILEQFLEQYEGCLLLVSHDRYFMDKTVDSLFIMEEDGNISGFVGKCSEYIEYHEEQKKSQVQKSGNLVVECPRGGFIETTGSTETTKNTASNNKSQSSEVVSIQPSTNSTTATKKKLSFKEQREFEQLNEEIPALEAEQKALEAKMSSSDFDEVRAAGDRYKEIEALLAEKYPRWEELAERA